jgi:hypothetical protein
MPAVQTCHLRSSSNSSQHEGERRSPPSLQIQSGFAIEPWLEVMSAAEQQGKEVYAWVVLGSCEMEGWPPNHL